MRICLLDVNSKGCGMECVSDILLAKRESFPLRIYIANYCVRGNLWCVFCLKEECQECTTLYADTTKCS